MAVVKLVTIEYFGHLRTTIVIILVYIFFGIKLKKDLLQVRVLIVEKKRSGR